jgi:hypothetical protein
LHPQAGLVVPSQQIALPPEQPQTPPCHEQQPRRFASVKASSKIDKRNKRIRIAFSIKSPFVFFRIHTVCPIESCLHGRLSRQIARSISQEPVKVVEVLWTGNEKAFKRAYAFLKAFSGELNKISSSHNLLQKI